MAAGTNPAHGCSVPGGEACPTRPTAARPRSSPPPVPLASAAPRDGPRPSCHVFTDGARVAAGRHRLRGNLPGVPHVGHVRAPLLQRAVGRCQRAYRACVSRVWASRRVVLGV